jgi:hypothetical protein
MATKIKASAIPTSFMNFSASELPVSSYAKTSRQRGSKLERTWILIGLVGKLLTGNPWVFTIKLMGLS